MKPRRVVLTVEVETFLPIRQIRSAYDIGLCGPNFVRWDGIIQIQANVVKVEKKRKGKR